MSFQFENKHTAKQMSDSSYQKLLHKACKFLGIVISHFLHLGRSAGPAQCELEEVNGDDSRALGNWKQDVFGSCYSTQLPLPAMRVMAGHDKRQGFHSNPRSTYFGTDAHQDLAKMIFPWLDGALEETNKCKNKTAAGFLSLMESLRWVILQDAAVMLSEHREHYIFTHNPEIFNSSSFRDFQTKLLLHIEDHKRDDRFNATLDSVLPGVHNRLDNQIFATQASNAKMNMMQSSIRGVIRNYEDFKEMYVTEKGEQMDEVNTSIRKGFEDVKNSMGNVFRGEVNAFVEHMGSYPMTQTPIGLLENAKTTVDLLKDAGANDESTHNQLMIRDEDPFPKTKQSTSSVKAKKTVQLYEMPKHFPTFVSMTVHWHQVVKEHESTGYKVWRNHLTASEKKRFQRFSRVINAYKKVLSSGVPVLEAENQFETYYSEHNHSLAKLSDTFARNILL